MQNADPTLNFVHSTNQTAKWNLYYFIVASCIAIFEQLQDLFKTIFRNYCSNNTHQAHHNGHATRC